MKKEFSKEYMIENCGCYSTEKLLLCSFMDGNITLQKIINSEIPQRDKYWFILRKTELTILQRQKIAIDVAEIVLPIFEAKNESKAPRRAIEAANKYLKGEIAIDKLKECRYAAGAAYAAAYAAAAAADADAAADAAYAAAAYAAAAAADAADADAAADAAYAAAAYAAAAAADAAAADAAADAAYAAAAYAAAAAADAAAAKIESKYVTLLNEYLINVIANLD